MKRRTFNKLLGGGLLAGTAPMIIGRAAAADPLGIGYVYVGPVEDFGWTHAHDVGRKAVESELGDQVKTSFVESVKEGPDSERVIADLASRGNKLIFTTSFGYMNPTLKVAKRFPDVKFEHCTGYKRDTNVATYNIRFYEGRYVQGVIAGHLSKSGVRSEGPDSERVIADLASRGNKLIFTTSFGYMNPTLKVAKRFPDVKFEHCTGYKRDTNVATYNIRFYEGRYVQGVIAGHLSKSGV